MNKPNCGQPPCGPSGTVTPFQPFPTSGVLFDNLNWTRQRLQDHIGRLAGRVCSYKMISVTLDEDGLLQQTGSGPNFQGGYLTICSCRHEIRAEKRHPREWLDWWFAGFTSPKELLANRFWLFYLAKIERVYASQADLWQWLAQQGIGPLKSSRCNPLGDAYEPRIIPCPDPLDAAYYHPPTVWHTHRKTPADDAWKKDIEFFHHRFKRHAPMLVAEPELTFLWQRPMLSLRDVSRNDSWDSVAAFLDDLLTV